MEQQKKLWAAKIAGALNAIIIKNNISGVSINEVDLVIETPPNPELGDLAFPMFPFAKIFRTAPAAIAKLVEAEIASPNAAMAGPYINIKIDYAGAASALTDIIKQGAEYGSSDIFSAKKIMIEFSCPNTNKPLHLGHLRNNILGESMARILKKNGADVMKVNLVNDRGVHICKSMLAYKKFGEGKTPESQGQKSDKFVGDFYIKYNDWSKKDPGAEEQVREMLIKWENGDPETLALWKKMNDWVISGIQCTYNKTGISFDRVYFEHETYKLGKAEILKGLERGIFYKEEDGSVWVDLSDIKLDKKVLLRKDGTSLYLTQDIGTAIARQGDFPFEQLIYVVGSEQDYHFKVLFHILKKLGFEWADQLYHLSYGMIYLPEGKMKSREGTVVDADDVIDKLSELAIKEIRDKERESEISDLEETGLSIALGALHYFLLQVNPLKDMIFNPAESISFNGNTGPYLQYMGARISSMLRKYDEKGIKSEFRPELLVKDEEKELIKLLLQFPEIVQIAGKNFNPSAITTFAYNLAKNFSRFYHDVPVLHCGDPQLMEARIILSRAVLQVLENAYELMAVPFLEKM